MSTLGVLLLLFVLIVLGTLPGARFRRSGGSGAMTYLAVFFGQLALVMGLALVQTLGLPDSWQVFGGLGMLATIPLVAMTALIATPIVLALVPDEDDWA